MSSRQYIFVVWSPVGTRLNIFMGAQDGAFPQAASTFPSCLAHLSPVLEVLLKLDLGLVGLSSMACSLCGLFAVGYPSSPPVAVLDVFGNLKRGLHRP